MQTQQATYLDFLGQPNTKMLIPVFQRIYTWSPWQCEELWDDICRAGATGEEHFIGSIVYTQEDVEGGVFRNIVDGQQRTTTVILLLIALRDYLREHGTTAAGNTAQQIEDRFLYNTAGDQRGLKFIAAPADHETLVHVLGDGELPESYKVSHRILKNRDFFVERMAADGFDPDVLWRGLESLFAIVIELGGGDNPQLIFEGINSKGMSLATSDLLRNKLFYGDDEAKQEFLLDTYWEPIEALFEGDKDQSNFNAALRAWLVEQDSSLEKYTPYELYSGFRKYVNESYTGTTEDLMSSLFDHCKRFKHMINAPMNKKHIDWSTGETGFGKGYGVTVGVATSKIYNGGAGVSSRGRMFP